MKTNLATVPVQYNNNTGTHLDLKLASDSGPTDALHGDQGQQTTL